MTRERFEKLVEDALTLIPKRFRREMKNVAIVVEDEPSDDLLDDMEIPDGDTLLGLYQGTPLPERGWAHGNNLPDRISIFQGPIEDACEEEDDGEELRRRALRPGVEAGECGRDDGAVERCRPALVGEQHEADRAHREHDDEGNQGNEEAPEAESLHALIVCPPRRGRGSTALRYSVIVERAPAAEVATPTPSRTSAA